MRHPLLFLAFLITAHLSAQYLVDNAAPKPADEFYRAGEKAQRSGDHRTAVVLYGQVLELEAEHINALLQRGFCHSMLKEYEMAITDLTAAIALKPENAWAYTSRGSAFAKLGQHDKAIADFDRVIQLDPKNEEAYNNRGWSRKALGDTDGACADWRTSQRMGNAEARIILKNNHCK
ncbi:MAG: tetratricopeptide repeat protein [Flavobacteriales bacterium]|nr:tetratricopeptide repeat protein [Flavobacteriales bacterium]MCC6938663.1 tetratricopeptide repeat protein [Flavobacteriales bacterium]